MPSLSRNAVLALIGLTLVLHTTEEYLAFPAILSSGDGRLTAWLAPPRLLHNAHQFDVALALVTVLPLLVIVWAIFSQRQALLISALFVETMLLVNAGAHLLSSLLKGGYEPGLITAVLINLPFGLYVLRRAVREQWIRAKVVWQMMGAAVVLHAVWIASSVLS